VEKVRVGQHRELAQPQQRRGGSDEGQFRGHPQPLPTGAVDTPGGGYLTGMANVQQPEQRRSEQDPLVTDSVKDTAANSGPQDKGNTGPVPPDQVSPYGPQEEDR
jgi:hypothetical protein